MRGLLIAFEGLDRTGKSTQIVNLHKFLTQTLQKKSEILKFPQRDSDVGKLIDLYLKKKTVLGDELVHLLFSANRWEFKDYILDTLKSGTSVILDRYAYSGVAYSTAKGLDFNWCFAPDIGLPAPDLVFYFEVESADLLAVRPDFGVEIYEKTDFQNSVLKVYKNKLVEKDWVRLNPLQSIEEITGQVERFAVENYEKLAQREVQFLKF